MFTIQPIAFSCPPLLVPVLSLAAGVIIAIAGCDGGAARSAERNVADAFAYPAVTGAAGGLVDDDLPVLVLSTDLDPAPAAVDSHPGAR
jgi:hypothetical protein